MECWKQSLLVWLRTFIIAILLAISAEVGINEEPAVGRNTPIHSDRLRIQLTFHPDPRLVNDSMLFCRVAVRFWRSRDSAEEMTGGTYKQAVVHGS